jgi:hypothetical protein
MPGVYQHLKQYVLPERRRLYERELARNEAGSTHSSGYRPESQHELFMNRWWQLWRRRTDMLKALYPLDRYIATSRVSGTSRTSVFAYVDKAVRPGDSLTVFAFDDDYSFGILSSAVHRAWLEARCSTLKGDLRYTPTTVWDSFPWPQTPSPASVQSIVDIVANIIGLRSEQLNAEFSLKRQYDVLRTPGKSRLRELHIALDNAVFAAYGFSEDEDVLALLLALNQDVAAGGPSARPPGPSGLTGVRVTQERLQVSSG